MERQSKKAGLETTGSLYNYRMHWYQSVLTRPPKSMKVYSIFHIILLELYRPSAILNRTLERPPPIVIDQEEQSEVKRGLDSRISRRCLFYLIQWKGYPDSENTWEPAANLKNVYELIHEFHYQYPNKPKV